MATVSPCDLVAALKGNHVTKGCTHGGLLGLYHFLPDQWHRIVVACRCMLLLTATCTLCLYLSCPVDKRPEEATVPRRDVEFLMYLIVPTTAMMARIKKTLAIARIAGYHQPVLVSHHHHHHHQHQQQQHQNRHRHCHRHHQHQHQQPLTIITNQHWKCCKIITFPEAGWEEFTSEALIDALGPCADRYTTGCHSYDGRILEDHFFGIEWPLACSLCRGKFMNSQRELVRVHDFSRTHHCEAVTSEVTYWGELSSSIED